MRVLFGSCLLVNTALSFEKQNKTKSFRPFLGLQNKVCVYKIMPLKTNIVFYINATDFWIPQRVCVEENCAHSSDCIYKENLFLFLIKVTFNTGMWATLLKCVHKTLASLLQFRIGVRIHLEKSLFYPSRVRDTVFPLCVASRECLVSDWDPEILKLKHVSFPQPNLFLPLLHLAIASKNSSVRHR